MKGTSQSAHLPDINELALMVFTCEQYDYEDLWLELQKIIQRTTSDGMAYLERKLQDYERVLDHTKNSRYQDDDTNKEKVGYERLVKLLATIKTVLENPTMDGAAAFKQNALFLIDIKNKLANLSPVYARSFVDQASVLITDDSIRYQALKRLSSHNNSPKETERIIRSAIVQCKDNVQLYDWYRLLLSYDNIDSVLRIFDQMEQAVSEKIAEEMGKKPYNINKIRDVESLMNSVIQAVGNLFEREGRPEERDRWYSNVKDKYKLENIIGGGVDYVQTLSQSAYVRLGSMQADLEKIKSSEQNHVRTIESKDALIERLREELAATKQERDALKEDNRKLRNEKLKSDDNIRRMVEAAKKVKGGMFGSGVKALQDMAIIIGAEQSKGL